MKFRFGVALASLAPLAFGALGAGDAFAADQAKTAVTNRTIGYVMTLREWSIYRTPGAKQECPHGVNDGEREQFKILYPEDGVQRSVVDTQLKWEGETWHPTLTPEPYEYRQVEGKISKGLNLDGKIGPNDFVSPDGEKGIDNQLYRAIGCIAGYNNSQPYMTFFEGNAARRNNFNRILIEISDVDDLTTDPDVTVTTYRGLDNLLADASGSNFLPGGTQRVDARFGKEFISTFKGKIVDGTLTTEAADLRLPLTIAFDSTGVHVMKGARFQLKLTGDYAQGYIGGYADAWAWYLQMNSGWSTHHTNYGQLSSPSLWRLFAKLADGYPDEQGRNTALSAAIDVQFARAYIVHPDKPVATDVAAPRADKTAR
ncbi:MAG: hypothetical protein AB7I36_11395 [Rhodospirillaceae bacterium]